MRADSRDARCEHHWRTRRRWLLLLLHHECSGCRIHRDCMLHMHGKRRRLRHRERHALRDGAARHDNCRAGLRPRGDGLLDDLHGRLRRSVLDESQGTCQREARSCCM